MSSPSMPASGNDLSVPLEVGCAKSLKFLM